MKICHAILNEFKNQSFNFTDESKTTRTKRIQTIFQNSYLLVGCMISFGAVRSVILFLEPSTLNTTLAFSVFLPGIILLGIILHCYVKSRFSLIKKTSKLSEKSLLKHENEIGFFSSIISLWILIWIPITIYYEHEKFDKGIQFMMSKMSLHLNHIIMMQPKIGRAHV